MIANAWAAGEDNPTSKHRIALELARKGHRVLWVEGAGMRRPSLGSGHDRGRIARKLRAASRGPREVHERIWVVTPLLVPIPSRAAVRLLNGWIYRAAMQATCRRLAFASPVLINYVPVLADAMKRWRGGRVVYHCVDRWDAFDMYDSAMMAEVDRQCCERADIVIASSQTLLERCRRHSPSAHLVMHGVDYDHFATALDAPARPDDLPAGPVVGFFGLLSEWLDQELVLRLADELPDAQLALIGTADVDVSRLETRENIHLLGPRPFSELPRYVARFAVGIIPFVVNELTVAVNPIKLREMMAAGCPVVSSAMPEVAKYADLVRQTVVVARDRDEFVDAVKARLAQAPDVTERRRLSERMRDETWEAKVAQILAVLESVP